MWFQLSPMISRWHVNFRGCNCFFCQLYCILYMILSMEEHVGPVEVGSLSHYWQGFMHSKWLAGFLPSIRKKEDETLERNNNWKNSRGPAEIWDTVDGRNPAITTWDVSKPWKQWDFNYQPQLVSQISGPSKVWMEFWKVGSWCFCSVPA